MEEGRPDAGALAPGELTEGDVHREGMQWYVVHTLTGQENKAKKFIDAQKANVELQDQIGLVLLKTEPVSEMRTVFEKVKDGKDKDDKDKFKRVPRNKRMTVERKLFPGYLLVQAAVYVVPDPGKPRKRVLNTECWRFITDAPGVIGFLGNERPVQLSAKEIDDIVFQAGDKGGKPRPRVDYAIDDAVTILEGPFKGSSGPVTSVTPDSGKLKVSVTIFGRPVDVDCEYWQVERRQDPQPPAGARE